MGTQSKYTWGIHSQTTKKGKRNDIHIRNTWYTVNEIYTNNTYSSI